MNKRQAEKLWSDLRDAFANAEKTIKEIIRTKAWEPIGYDSFVAAWNDRMKGVPLATDVIRAHVVYAMFDEGLNPTETVQSLGIGSRVGPESAETLKRQYDNKVPADLATTRVREHDRHTPPSPPSSVHVKLPEDEYTALKDWAKEESVTPSEVAATLLSKALHEVYLLP